MWRIDWGDLFVLRRRQNAADTAAKTSQLRPPPSTSPVRRAVGVWTSSESAHSRQRRRRRAATRRKRHVTALKPNWTACVGRNHGCKVGTRVGLGKRRDGKEAGNGKGRKGKEQQGWEEKWWKGEGQEEEWDREREKWDNDPQHLLTESNSAYGERVASLRSQLRDRSRCSDRTELSWAGYTVKFSSFLFVAVMWTGLKRCEGVSSPPAGPGGFQPPGSFGDFSSPFSSFVLQVWT